MDIEYEYFNWLCGEADMASPFLFLARLLHQREFSAIVKKDLNRIMDGRALRNRFLDTRKYASNRARDEDAERIGKPECSVLELIIGLAERLQFMYADSPYEKTTGQWTHELISNLGLGYMTDNVLVEFPEYSSEAQKIVNALIERTYGPDGKGGIFPLCRPKQDQRKAEIWDQLMAYCMERYDMSGDAL